jgi:hypothetical protein
MQITVRANPTMPREPSRRARLIPRKDWEIQVMPPDEVAFDSGARACRCLAATVSGPYLPTPEFGR